MLRYFEDLAEADIAEVLDCSVGTVKSQLSKARAKLEKELQVTLEERRPMTDLERLLMASPPRGGEYVRAERPVRSPPQVPRARPQTPLVRLRSGSRGRRRRPRCVPLLHAPDVRTTKVEPQPEVAGAPEIVATVEVGGEPVSIDAATGSEVWVAGDDRLVAIDPETNEPAASCIDIPADEVAVGDDSRLGGA